MTKECIINNLNYQNKMFFGGQNETLNEAIKALEQQKPMEKFENARDHICKLAGDYKCWDNRLSYEESLELCNILEQQPSDESIKHLECNNIDVQKFTEALKMQPLQIIKPNTSDDCVSRQAVIDLVNAECVDLQDGSEVWRSCVNDTVESIYLGVKDLPPITPTQSWIPVSEELPKDRDWYLGIFREHDTGWINPLPFVCDFVGKETKATTKEFWILHGFTDIDIPCDYYKNLECVAWQPLPLSYQGE